MKVFERTHHGIHYTVQGEGQPVILLHGIASSRHNWNHLIPELVAAGFSAIAADLPGHGDSHKPADPRSYHCQSVYATLETWLDSLELDQPPLLVGHSMGGYISLHYSLRRPHRVRGLALVNPFYTARQLSPMSRLLVTRPALGGQATQLVPEWVLSTAIGLDPSHQERFPASTRRQIAADIKRASPHIFHIPRTSRDLSPDLASVLPRALVIWGSRDLTLRPGSFADLVRQLPNAAGQPVPGCGHQPHVGQPRVVNPLILRFARSL